MNSQPAPEPRSSAFAAPSSASGSSAGTTGDASAHLRGIEGGYDLARWPILVAPVEGELGESWLLRVADRYGMIPSRLIAEAGVGPPAWTGGEARRGRALTAVAQRVGCARPRIRSAAATMLLDWVHHGGRARVPRCFPRFCPRCLADSGGVWMVEWSNPLMVICPRHDVFLLRECPACGLVPFAADAWSTRIASGRQCPNQVPSPSRAVRQRYGWCDGDLSDAPVEEASPVLRAAQEDVLAALRRALTSPAAAVRLPIGWTVTAAEYAQAVLELLDEQLPRSVWGEAEGPDLALIMYVARAVLQAREADTLRLYRARHEVLHPGGDHTPLRRGASHLRRGNSPLLMSLMLASIADGMSLADRLMFRTATGRPRFPGAPASLAPGAPRVQGAWPARGWVPPWLWDGALAAHVKGRGPYAPAVVSLALSKVGSSVPLRAIAADLGLPSWLADRARSVLRRTSAEDLDRLVTDVDAFYEQLAQSPPPIDYSQRVDDGRDLGRVYAAAREAGGRQGQWSAEDAEAMAILLWSVYTASHPRFHPRTRALTWRVAWPPDLDIGRFLVDAYALLPHADGEPMTWHPPGTTPRTSWRSPVANCDAHAWDCPPRGCSRATAHLRYALDRLVWSGSRREEKPQQLRTGDWVPRGARARQRFDAEGERLRRVLLIDATPWPVLSRGHGSLARTLLTNSFAPARWEELMTDARLPRARPTLRR